MKSACRRCVPKAVFLLAMVLAAALGQAQPASRPAGELPRISVATTQPVGNLVKVACTMRGLGDAGQVIEGKGGIRIRGSTSQAYPKKSYLVALESPLGLLGMGGRKQWILNAAYIDRSLMRHKLAYDLFRSLATPDRPRHAVQSRFVEVDVNGEYMGVYLLMERVDAELLGFAPAALAAAKDPAHACLYKAISHDADFGGGHEGYEQEVPDPVAMPYWGALDELMRFVQTAPAEAFADPAAGIGTRIDLDNAIDFHLLVLVTCNADGITKNFYLARQRPEPGQGAKFFFVPWDYDGTFGRNWDTSPLPPTLWLSNSLFERLMRDAAYRKRFAERWAELRDNQFSVKTIHAMIDANAALIGPAMKRTVERWPTNRGPYRDRVTFEQDVEQMKVWVAARIPAMDRMIERMMQRGEGRRR